MIKKCTRPMKDLVKGRQRRKRAHELRRRLTREMLCSAVAIATGAPVPNATTISLTHLKRTPLVVQPLKEFVIAATRKKRKKTKAADSAPRKGDALQIKSAARTANK